MVRRGSSRGVSAASSPTCGSAGGAVMVGVLGGAVGGSCFFLRLLTTSPLIAPTATRAMTTARMTISITLPVSGMGRGQGPVCGFAPRTEGNYGAGVRLKYDRSGPINARRVPFDHPPPAQRRAEREARNSTPMSTSTPDEPQSALETRGLEPVPDAERTARTRELFPTWVAANISVLLLTMGASLVVAYKLNFWQAIVVAVAAPDRLLRPGRPHRHRGQARRRPRHGALARGVRPARQPAARFADLGGALGLGDHQRGDRRLCGADRARHPLRDQEQHVPDHRDARRLRGHHVRDLRPRHPRRAEVQQVRDVSCSAPSRSWCSSTSS